MRRFTFATLVLLLASLLLAVSCKSKDATEDSAPADTQQADTDQADTDQNSADADADAPADDDNSAGNDKAPTVILNAPEEGLLEGQGIKTPAQQEDTTDDSGLKLQLGGGSGYGYQRNQPSLLDN